MSAETLAALEDAIRQHAADMGPDGVVVEWVAGFGVIDSEDGYTCAYAMSAGNTPSSSYGLAHLTLECIKEDIEIG